MLQALRHILQVDQMSTFGLQSVGLKSLNQAYLISLLEKEVIGKNLQPNHLLSSARHCFLKDHL
jgi:hypothetical protein